MKSLNAATLARLISSPSPPSAPGVSSSKVATPFASVVSVPTVRVAAPSLGSLPNTNVTAIGKCVTGLPRSSTSWTWIGDADTRSPSVISSPAFVLLGWFRNTRSQLPVTWDCRSPVAV